MTKQQLVEVLQELSFACKSITSKEQLREVIFKYDILFGGPNHNVVYSVELYHCLKIFFEIDTSLEELNILLPDVCSELGIHCDAMIYAAKLPEHVLAGFQITL